MAPLQRSSPDYSWKVVFDFRGTDTSIATVESRIDRWARILRKDILKTIAVEQRLVYRTGDIIFAKTIASMARDLGGRVTISADDKTTRLSHKLTA